VYNYKLLNTKTKIIANVMNKITSKTTGSIFASISRVISKQSLQNVFGITIAGGTKIERSKNSPIISLLHL
jgi:hypothetical protein